ncbi:MAG: hypothetical protein ACI89Z_001053 [Porticoccus sp.]|jgi:hypothetical protein
MKYLLVATAVFGLIYVVFIESNRSQNNDDRPEVIYQREVNKLEDIEGLLQENVDQIREEMDEIR